MNTVSIERSLPFVKQHSHVPELNDDPHAHYAELRRTTPICRTSDLLFRGKEGYMVTRYDDVRFILTDRRFSSNPESMTTKSGFSVASFLMKHERMLNVMNDSMVLKDDPDHRRLRGIVNALFTFRAVLQMEQNVQTIVDRLFDDIARKQTVDLVREFSVPLPLAVIAEMMGVDPTDRDDFARWMKKLSKSAAGEPLQMLLTLPTAHKLLGLFDRLIRQRRTNPDDKLISAILQARYEGDQLDDHEVLAMIFLLLLAGHDTTANLIAMSTLTLIENPDHMEQLREHPEMMQSAVEELLRYTVPVVTPAPRMPTEDLEVCGIPVAKGTPVLGMIISANRDEDVFPDPNTLDFTRDPNPHLGFGFGGHMCLGIMLARLEARIALSTMLRRFSCIELTVPREEIHHKPGALRGLQTLPIRLVE